MENKFFKGFLTGVISIIIALTLFFSIKSVMVKTINLVFRTGRINIVSDYKNFNEKLDDIQALIKNYYYKDLDKDSYYEQAYKNLVEAVGDPYTSYFSKEEFDDFMMQMEGTYEGIGVPIMYLGETNDVVVIGPYKDSPGERAGLKTGDIIRKVNGQDVKGFDIDKVAELIRGKKGTDVTITIARNPDQVFDLENFIKNYAKINFKEIDLVVTRDEIIIPTIESEIVKDDIGYIRIYGFDGPTHQQFVEALDSLKDLGMKGLIIDVRGNPGGYLHTVVEIVDEIIDQGIVVYTQDKKGNRENYEAVRKGGLDLPIAVLIDNSSASASEILAGALQDYGKATIIGSNSFGKGLVQDTFRLRDGSAIKITISKYYTPNGNYIQEIGIKPDIVIEYKEETGVEIDNQLRKAIEVVEEQILVPDAA